MFYNTPEATSPGDTIQKLVEALSTQPTDVSWSWLDGHESHQPGVGGSHMAVVASSRDFIIQSELLPSTFQ
jgi:hypothetical protein